MDGIRGAASTVYMGCKRGTSMRRQHVSRRQLDRTYGARLIARGQARQASPIAVGASAGVWATTNQWRHIHMLICSRRLWARRRRDTACQDHPHHQIRMSHIYYTGYHECVTDSKTQMPACRRLPRIRRGQGNAAWSQDQVEALQWLHLAVDLDTLLVLAVAVLPAGGHRPRDRAGPTPYRCSVATSLAPRPTAATRLEMPAAEQS